VNRRAYTPKGEALVPLGPERIVLLGTGPLGVNFGAINPSFGAKGPNFV